MRVFHTGYGKLVSDICLAFDMDYYAFISFKKFARINIAINNVSYHTLFALEVYRVGDGRRQRDAKEGWVHKAHGKDQHQSKIQKVYQRMIGGKGISILHFTIPFRKNKKPQPLSDCSRFSRMNS